ncbi:MAG: hypothetical protein M1503_11505 [Thaumarchaeota archaeon]|nr:hypothetical protein [Nitrososphaerota archaeon]MCL5318869.1 hypothetical protein [Nitrososphaerota archaeon]
MTEFDVIVRDGASNPVKNAKVTVDGKNSQFTDNSGKTHYNINEWNKTLEITANTLTYATTGTIAVDWLGVAQPDKLELTLHFDPTATGIGLFTNLGETSSWLVPLLLVLGVVVAIVTVIWMISKGKSPVNVSAITEKVKETTRKAGKRAKKRLPKGWKA